MIDAVPLTLLASLLALAIGPLFLRWARSGPQVATFLGGFTFVSIAGLLGFSILPEAIATGGWLAWPFLLLGIGFPALLEPQLQRVSRQAHAVILLLGVTGLAAHSLIDGIALALPATGDAGHAHTGNLALAVVLHRLPVGLAVWTLIAHGWGARMALALMMFLTVAGYGAGSAWAGVLDTPAMA